MPDRSGSDQAGQPEVIIIHNIAGILVMNKNKKDSKTLNKEENRDM
ncbi:Hypothetical protein LUCI_1500 [Lucifera butyrica]|uniref:Uncharacterized protein n=1 Tax=Lucifera butyrica TaxID=1351585 RepID=A0A498R4C5_9FIRM|nr:Hypothetical protein LUCI_1500 [Lucifera butyrica]